jgi:hypothetical protein
MQTASTSCVARLLPNLAGLASYADEAVSHEIRDKGGDHDIRHPHISFYDYGIGRAQWLDIFSTVSEATILLLPRHQASLLSPWLDFSSPAWSWRDKTDWVFSFHFVGRQQQTKVLNHMGYEEGAARRYTPLSCGTAILRPGLLLLEIPLYNQLLSC